MEIAEQVVEVGLGDLVGEVRGHRRELRDAASLDHLLRDARFLALRIGEHQELALFLEQEPGDELAVLQRELSARAG